MGLIRSQVFIEMGFKVNREAGIALYKKDLQDLLVEHTRDFYRGKAKLWLAQDACPDYMRKAEVSCFARWMVFDASLMSTKSHA